MNRFYPQISRLKAFQEYVSTSKTPFEKDLQALELGSNTCINRGHPFIIQNTHAVDRFSVLPIINQLSPVTKSKTPYRSVALLTKDIFSAAKHEGDINQCLKHFHHTASKKQTNWIVCDEWVLDQFKLSAASLASKYPNKFIGLIKIPTDTDLTENSIITIFEDDQLEATRHVRQSDIYISTLKNDNSNEADSLFLDDDL